MNTRAGLWLFAGVLLCTACRDKGEEPESDTANGDAGQRNDGAEQAGRGGSDSEGTQPPDVGTLLDVRRFQSSLCKPDSQSDLFTERTGEEYTGLRCVAWDMSDSRRARIDLVNFPEICGFYEVEDLMWRGEAQQDENGGLWLFVEWDDLRGSNACGDCLVDFSFEIDGVEFDEMALLEMATRSCRAGCGWREYSAVLPVGEFPSGIRCRYAEFDERYWFADAPLGELHMPPDEGACSEGLTAVDTAAGERCVPTCSDDPDCPLAELLSCQHGTCLLSEQW